MAKKTRKPSKPASRPPKTVAEDRSRFVDPFADEQLSAYLKSVLEWHGYIRFLGLPHLKDNPDVRIDRMFIEPFIADRQVSADADPERWPPTVPLIEAVERNPRLVLLGDPGSGKSTLVNWIAWQFAREAESDWTRRFGRLIPIPLVLRELNLRPGMRWDDLWRAFLEQRLVASLELDSTRLVERLECGQAMIVLDGLDEIGSNEIRESLRGAVIDGMQRYPDCRWLLTSRIVGYERVPFHHMVLADGRESHDEISVHTKHTLMIAEQRYVAPFNDRQIEQFVCNWFAQRDAVRERAARTAGDLIEAIHVHKSTRVLARIPNLLTMMSLIYRVEAWLPHGRTLLYDKIAETYLESLDRIRKLRGEMEYPLPHKKRWLARVGFEMQRRRSDNQRQKERRRPHQRNPDREILVDKEELCDWISHAMEESGYGSEPHAAIEFVDHLGRRSGLLLPRGEGEFSFMHLSFQEYFAACFLKEQILSPPWLLGADVETGADQKSLAEFANWYSWRETLIHLFEMLSELPLWPEALSRVLFGADFSALEPTRKERGRLQSAAILLAHLAVDPHSGFKASTRHQAVAACCRWVTVGQATWEEMHALLEDQQLVLRELLAGGNDQAPIWDALVTAGQAANLDRLSLDNIPIVDATPLSGLRSLQWLDLNGTAVTDVSPLANLPKLKRVDLSNTGVTDVSPLCKLLKLQTLFLSDTSVTDISPLSGLPNLQCLHLRRTNVTDISPLSRLPNLQILYLNGTGVTDVSPLAGLPNLLTLDLRGTDVTDEQVRAFKQQRLEANLTADIILDR